MKASHYPLLAAYFFFCISNFAYSQYSGNANDWIDYSKTYYRFSVEEDGIYKLATADLLAAGINEADLVGAHFKMIRNGIEIPLYVSTDNTFGADDYLEFFGEKNKGDSDNPLYPSSLQQPSEMESLFSKKAIHFLTLDADQQNQRFTALENNLEDLPSIEKYFMTEVFDNSGAFHLGKYYSYGGVSLYESTFDNCEGVNLKLNQGATQEFDFLADHIYQDEEIPVTVDFKVASEVPAGSQSGNVAVSIDQSNSQQISIAGRYEYDEFSVHFMNTDLSESKFKVVNQTSAKILLPEKKLTYPRTFDFSNQAFSTIQLSKSGSAYLELLNISDNGEALVLYDLSSKERIEQPISAKTPIRTSANSTQNDLVFDSQIDVAEFIGEINFTDYTTTSNDLLLIYHPILENAVNGENYVEKYVNHKSSTIGGELMVEKINYLELVDQFIYGIDQHPAAIKNFVAELKQKGKLPKNILLLGKGYEYNIVFQSDLKSMIPTYGSPGSDNLLVSDYGTSNMNCGIGRIGARNPSELKAYVDKVIEYQTSMSQTDDAEQTKDKLWMKRGIHIGGGKYEEEANVFETALNNFKETFEATRYGGNVTSFFKADSHFGGVQDEDSPSMTSLIAEGVGVINYFGHASVNSLEYSLNDFSAEEQQGRYPFMFTNGCHSGDLFQESASLSEDFVLADQAGTLSFLGASQYGVTAPVYQFCAEVYNSFVNTNYGASIGEVIQQSQNALTENNYKRRLTKQQFIYHGDPSLSIYAHSKPDYLVSEQDIVFYPEDITAATTEFQVEVTISNIGKAVDEPVEVLVTRELPNGDVESQTKTIEQVYYQEKVTFTFATLPFYAAGENKFAVEIDAQEDLDEITRSNNTIHTGTLSKPVITEIVKPIYPSEFAITNDSNLELQSYTPIFTAAEQTFEIQIDTTKHFNSELREDGVVHSKGGVIKWVPELLYEDEVVYYWRIKKQGEQKWSNSSFVFLEEHQQGWNQSHYFQLLSNQHSNIDLKENRKYEFGVNHRELNVRTAKYPIIPYSQASYSIDGVVQATNRCHRDIAVVMIDKHTGIPIENEHVGSSRGLYGSIYCSRWPSLFYFDVKQEQDRLNMITMLDAVEEGNYVLIYSLNYLKPEAYGWQEDEVSLIEKLEENGAQLASNIPEEAPYVFYFQKGNTAFAGMREVVGEDSNSIIDEDLDLPVNFGRATVTTPLIGPVASWNSFSLQWQGDEGEGVTYTIKGVSSDGNETLIVSDATSESYDLSETNASSYPYIKVEIEIEDESEFTPVQLQQLRLTYEPLPDLAIDATELANNLAISQSTLSTLSYKVENITDKDASELLVGYDYIEDIDNVEQHQQRYASIAAGESIEIDYTIDVLSGGLSDYIRIELNPNEDQAELYAFNNVALVSLSSTPLPVKYTYFTAEALEDRTVLLEWGTASESNNSHFEVERSMDGVSFELIGEIQGGGTTSVEQEYEYIDASPRAGINYYRIKQVDYNGQYEYTEIESVTIEAAMAIYPNPATTHFQIDVAEGSENGMLSIYNLNGNTLQQNVPFNTNDRFVVSQMKKGLYVVIFTDSTGTAHRFKLIVG